LFVRMLIRPMSKVLNPVIVKFAGVGTSGWPRRSSMWAGVGEDLCDSATAYVHGDVILIALTFGNQSDWARNVRAVGGRQVRVNGRPCQATSPRSSATRKRRVAFIWFRVWPLARCPL
jgi:hypothetical protein